MVLVMDRPLVPALHCTVLHLQGLMTVNGFIMSAEALLRILSAS
jgi:hypothetical protein